LSTIRETVEEALPAGVIEEYTSSISDAVAALEDREAVTVDSLRAYLTGRGVHPAEQDNILRGVGLLPVEEPAPV
jgi:hypothetical protein